MVVDGVEEEGGTEPGPPDDRPPVDGKALLGVEIVGGELLIDDSGAPEEKGDDGTGDPGELDGNGFGCVEVRPDVVAELPGDGVLDGSGPPPEDTGVLMDAGKDDSGLPVGRGAELGVSLVKDGISDE